MWAAEPTNEENWSEPVEEVKVWQQQQTQTHPNSQNVPTMNKHKSLDTLWLLSLSLVLYILLQNLSPLLNFSAVWTGLLDSKIHGIFGGEFEEVKEVPNSFWRASLPAEVEERPAGLWNILIEPGQEVELSDGSGLVGLHVLQVEAPNQEVIAPNVFWHQVYLWEWSRRALSHWST